MIQEIAIFVDPDPWVEFDPASRVSGHASLKFTPLLSLSSSLLPGLPLRRSAAFSSSARNLLSLILFARLSLSLSVALVHSSSLSASRSLDENKKSNWTSAWCGERRRRRRRKRRNTNLSRGEEEPRAAGGTRTESKVRLREGGGGERGGGGEAAREKGEEARGATKVAVTLRANRTRGGPKGKKARRAALRGHAEGNGRAHEEEARLDGEVRRDEGKRRCQGCEVVVVVPRATSASRIK